MAANERLAELMRQAGFLTRDGSVGLKSFARAVREVAARHKVEKGYTHTYVVRWLDGVVPRDRETPQFVAEALGSRLGRVVGLEELGFGVSYASPDIGVTYPVDTAGGIDAVTQLWQADADGVHTLAVASPHSAAWSEASLTWLVRNRQESVYAPSNGQRVGIADIARVRTTTEMFARLDNQFGGGHVRRSFVEFLRTTVAGLLRGSYTEEAGRSLFSAAAEATLLAAWSSYDAGVHGLAQRYFIQALRLAQSADDLPLAGSILDAMSHQATFLGNYQEAVNLARAARLGTAPTVTATLTAHFYLMEARAHARLGDRLATDRALSAAVDEFERRKPENDPSWIQYFDETELADEFCHCNHDLGRASEASSYALRVIDGTGVDFQRNVFFATMVLADSYLDQGEPERAFPVALTGLKLGEELSSARCAAYVADFRSRLARVGGAAARDFIEQARASPLWAPTR